MERPGRPLGVSLAIIASSFLFAVVPLMQVVMVLLVQRHFMNLSFEEGFEPFVTGGDFLGIPESSILLQSLLSIGFLIIAGMAWRGRPPAMRYILVVAVAVLTGIKLVGIITQSLSAQDMQTMSSLDALSRSLGTSQVIFDLLVTVYVIWYMNRGPARAFYRGYYVHEPKESVMSET